MNNYNEYDFDSNDWQGRRNEQVESSYKVIGWTMGMLILYMVGYLAYAIVI